jgi:hypothetical protein
MVHGDCSSRGCYAMTDEQIQEIYALARESFFGGQKAFQLEAFPFRMTALNMAKHRNNPNFAFWKMLKQGYDHFEATRQEPKVAVCEKHYVFDAVAPDNDTKPLRFDARGKCPAFQLDKTIADVVLDHQRKEQIKMAEYIAQGVATVPMRQGIDGGMNPVFADKIASQEGYDSKGQLIQVATAPGSLPRGNKPIPQTLVTVPKTANDNAAAPVMMASVPVPLSAPEPKIGQAPAEKPTSIAGLLGNIFGGAETGPEKQATAERAASPNKRDTRKRHASVRTASAHDAADLGAPRLRGQTHDAAPAPQPKAAAANPPEPQPALARNANANKPEVASAGPRAESHALRTAYSSPQTSGSGLLVGAQPVMPVGSFDARWSGFR